MIMLNTDVSHATGQAMYQHRPVKTGNVCRDVVRNLIDSSILTDLSNTIVTQLSHDYHTLNDGLWVQ